MTSTSPRSLALFAAVTVLVALGAWQLLSRPGLTVNAEDSALDPVMASEPSVSVAPLAPELDELKERDTARVEAIETTAQVEPVTPKTTETEAGFDVRVLLAGTVVLEDENGVIHQDLSGELSLTVWNRPEGSSPKGTFGRNVGVPIEGGRFEAVVRVGAAGEVSTEDGKMFLGQQFEELIPSLDQ